MIELIVLGVLFIAGCEAASSDDDTNGSSLPPDHGAVGGKPPLVEKNVPESQKKGEEVLGSTFSLKIGDEYQNCVSLAVTDVVYSPTNDVRLLVQAVAKWSSYPANPFSMGAVQRASLTPISEVTSDYPEYGGVSLTYFLHGTLDLNAKILEFTLQNANVADLYGAGVTLFPLYKKTGQTEECQATTDFSNEAFFALAPQKISLPLEGSTGICSPCKDINGVQIPYDNLNIQME